MKYRQSVSFYSSLHNFKLFTINNYTHYGNKLTREQTLTNFNIWKNRISVYYSASIHLSTHWTMSTWIYISYQISFAIYISHIGFDYALTLVSAPIHLYYALPNLYDVCVSLFQLLYKLFGLLTSKIGYKDRLSAHIT